MVHVGLQKNKVLVLVHSGALGGASRSVVTVIDHLRKGSYDVIVLAPPGPLSGTLEKMGATVVNWLPPDCQWFGRNIVASGVAARGFNVFASRFLAIAKMPSRLLRGARLIREVITKESISIVYVNSLVLFPLAGFLARTRNVWRIRVLWQIREVLSSSLPNVIYAGIVKSIARASDIVVAISANEASPFRSCARVEIVHNAVPDGWAAARQQDDAEDSGRRRVLMACDFQTGKGIGDFLSMASLLYERCPDVEFQLYTPHPRLARGPTAMLLQTVGVWNDKVPLVSEVLESATELRLSGSVRMIFDVGMTLQIYQKATVYVRADRAGCPWGRDIIEAMWAGVPVVATGTCQEFVLEGKTGFLVPPELPSALAERVYELLADAELRKRMAEATRVRAIEMFSPEVFAARMLRLFTLEAGSAEAVVDRGEAGSRGQIAAHL